MCIGERLQGHFRVSRKLVRRLSSQLQSDSGKRRRRWRMETESPQGLNLHPAKQPRTTLFDWLPAGLLSLHGRTYTDRSVFLFSLSLSMSYFFLLLPSHSLLSFCFFGTVPLPFLSFSHLRPPCSPLDRFPIGIISAMAARNALSRTM